METKNIYSDLMASAIDQKAVVLTVAGIRSTTSVDDPSSSYYLEVTLRDEEADDLGITTVYKTLSNTGLSTFRRFFNVDSLDRLIGRRVRCVLAANKSLVFFLPTGGDKSTVLSFGNADLPLLVDISTVAAWVGVDMGEDEDNPPVELPNFPAPGMYEVNAIDAACSQKDRLVEITFKWNGHHVILGLQCDKLVDFDTFLRTVGMDYGSFFVVHVGEDWSVKINNTALSCSYISVDTEGNATIAEFSPLSKEALKRVEEVRKEYIGSSIKIAAALASNLTPEDEDDVADMTDAITRRVLSRAEVAVRDAMSLIRMAHEVTKA